MVAWHGRPDRTAVSYKVFFFFFPQSKEWNLNLYLQDMTGYEIPHRNKFRGQLHRVCTVYNCSSIVSFVKSATITNHI